jgi:hypothetical protein
VVIHIFLSDLIGSVLWFFFSLVFCFHM